MIRTPDFFTGDDGAVTVDWVVLTAALVGLGLATAGVVSVGVESQSNALGDQLKRKGISTTFYGDDAPTWQSLVDHSQMQMSLGGQVTFRDTGGSDDIPGYIELVDDAGVLDMVDLGFDFQGDQSDMLGDSITFDLGVFAGSAQPTHGATEPLFQVTSHTGDLLTYHTAQTPGPGTWTTFDVTLTADTPGWTLNGDPVTDAQMEQVLSNIATFEMRGEHFNGDETIGIDNMYVTHRRTGLDYR